MLLVSSYQTLDINFRKLLKTPNKSLVLGRKPAQIDLFDGTKKLSPVKGTMFFTLSSLEELRLSSHSDMEEFGFPMFNRRVKQLEVASAGHLVERAHLHRVTHLV